MENNYLGKKDNFRMRKGMTIAELLITIFVFSLIMVGVNQLFIKSWENYKLVMNTNTATMTANKGMSDVINVLRKVGDGGDGSYPIFSADDFDLKIFSDIDRDGIVERVHYYLNGSDLMVGTTEPAGFPLAYASVDSETSLIVANVVNESVTPLFSYYNNQNNLIAAPVGNLVDVRMIKVELIVDRKEGDLNVESFVSLRNLSENDTIK